MALLLLYGQRFNALERMYAEPTPDAAVNTKYPVTNLYDGIPNKPCILNAAAGSAFDFDLQMIPNGTMEDAFSGGLPAAGWAKGLGTTTTITRDTGVFNEGAASAKLDFASAASAVDNMYYEFQARPGEVLVFSAESRSTAGGTTAKVVIKNLDSGSWLTGAGAWQGTVANFVSSTSTTWATATQTVTVESYAACGYKDLVTIQVLAGFGSTPNNDIYFDNIRVFPAINCAFILGHNTVPHSAPVVIKSGTSSPAGTTRGTFTLAQPTMFTTFADVQARYWRLEFNHPGPIEPIYIGELVLGYYQTATRRQNYGQDYTLTDPQDRSGNDIGPLQAYIRTERGRRQVSMQFRLNDTATDYAQWKEILERSRNGAIPILAVIESGDASTAIMGRVEQSWRHTRVTNNVRDHALVLDEMPFPVVIS